MSIEKVKVQEVDSDFSEEEVDALEVKEQSFQSWLSNNNIFNFSSIKKFTTSTINWSTWAIKGGLKGFWILSTTGMLTLFPYYLASRREYEMMTMEMEMQEYLQKKQATANPILAQQQPPAESGIPQI